MLRFSTMIAEHGEVTLCQHPVLLVLMHAVLCQRRCVEA